MLLKMALNILRSWLQQDHYEGKKKVKGQCLRSKLLLGEVFLWSSSGGWKVLVWRPREKARTKGVKYKILF